MTGEKISAIKEGQPGEVEKGLEGDGCKVTAFVMIPDENMSFIYNTQ